MENQASKAFGVKCKKCDKLIRLQQEKRDMLKASSLTLTCPDQQCSHEAEYQSSDVLSGVIHRIQ